MSVPTGTLCGMDSELPSTLRNLARHQNGVISRAQALRAGLTEDMIKFRIRSGRWRQIHLGVYATFTGVPGRSPLLWAAVLSAGKGAMLSHETAAELHGLIDKAADPIHVTVPRHRHLVAVCGVSIHRSARAVEAVLGHSYPPRTRIEETVLDLTQTAQSFDDVCGWVTRAFARDLTDERRLRAAMGLRTKLRWRADLAELITAAAGGDHSVLEFRYDRDVERAHGLPVPGRQVPFTGRAAAGGAGTACTRATGWWSKRTGGSLTRRRASGRTTPGTTRRPWPGCRPSGMTGRRSGVGPARRRPRWPGCCASMAGRAGRGRARPAARFGGRGSGVPGRGHQAWTAGQPAGGTGSRALAGRPGKASVRPRQYAARSAEACMASAPNSRRLGSLTATRPR
jgi:hypothetical protein